MNTLTQRNLLKAVARASDRRPSQQILRFLAVVTLSIQLLNAISSRSIAQNTTSANAPVIEALQKGDYENALHICADLLHANPESPQLWTLRAVAFDRSSRPHEALDAYRQALKIAPNYLPALEGSAQIEYNAGSNEAMPFLVRIVGLEPKNETAHAMLGALEYRKRDFVKAAADFELGRDSTRSQPASLMDYALSLMRVNREPEAIPVLQRLLSLDPGNGVARYDLALIQWRASTPTEALATLQPLLDASSPDSRTLRLAAAIHEADNETPQAIQLLRSAILANPDEIANYLDFATLASAHASFSVGVDIVSAGLSRHPNSAALYMARGVLYGQNGEFAKAMDDFERAHKLDPEFSMADTAEGIAESQHQNHEAALASFQRQVKEHPKDALGYYLLAEWLSWAPSGSKHGSDASHATAQALAAVLKATSLDPHLVQAWDLLASLYLQTERSSDAAKASRAALMLEPKDQQALYTLILALRKTGSKEELSGLVQQLTQLRKEEQIANSQKNHYGQLVESQ